MMTPETIRSEAHAVARALDHRHPDIALLIRWMGECSSQVCARLDVLIEQGKHPIVPMGGKDETTSK